MQKKIDHDRLKAITRDSNHYSDMVVGCMSQYLGTSSQGCVQVPGGVFVPSPAAVQFLIDAKVLVDNTEPQ